MPPTAGQHDESRAFRAVRDAHRVERAEDYVEAIHAIAQRDGRCRVCDLARHMGVSHVTVTRTLTRLRAGGLLETAARQPLKLTESGTRLAKRARERHDVVLRFLLHIGVPASAATIDAEGLEHHVGEQTIRAMRAALKAST